MQATNLGYCLFFGVHAGLKLNTPILPRIPLQIALLKIVMKVHP